MGESPHLWRTPDYIGKLLAMILSIFMLRTCFYKFFMECHLLFWILWCTFAYTRLRSEQHSAPEASTVYDIHVMSFSN